MPAQHQAPAIETSLPQPSIDDTRIDWVQPQISVQQARDATQGQGGGGPDFGSELGS